MYTAVQETDPDNDKIDKIVYQRILGDFRDSSVAQDPKQLRYENRLSAQPLKQNVDNVLVSLKQPQFSSQAKLSILSKKRSDQEPLLNNSDLK